MSEYTVIVGNVGTVHTGHDYRLALADYWEYVRESEYKCGRAAGESVTLFTDGEISREHTGGLQLHQDALEANHG